MERDCEVWREAVMYRGGLLGMERDCDVCRDC